MLTGRPKPTLQLTVGERTQLKSLAASRSLPHALVCRAKVVLWSAEGQSNTQVAERLGWAKVTVGKWRQRFLEQRVAGLYDELRPGRPRSIADEQIAVLLKRTLLPQARRGYALERSPSRLRQWHFQINRASRVPDLCRTAAQKS